MLPTPPFPVHENKVTTFLILNGSEFIVGFVIGDPELGPLIHRQVYDNGLEAQYALRELEADLYDRPVESLSTT
jgi:hypothetical protein